MRPASPSSSETASMRQIAGLKQRPALISCTRIDLTKRRKITDELKVQLRSSGSLNRRPPFDDSSHPRQEAEIQGTQTLKPFMGITFEILYSI
ncbi:hypothetical protein Mapa_009132 [Marchantia paleacea]|nr:hypothetical protein Mapa_009132 [Marchantia paleacea]